MENKKVEGIVETHNVKLSNDEEGMKNFWKYMQAYEASQKQEKSLQQRLELKRKIRQKEKQRSRHPNRTIPKQYRPIPPTASLWDECF